MTDAWCLEVPMPWNGPVAAIILTSADPGSTRIIDATSTSTVWMQEAGQAPELLIFGVGVRSLTRATGLQWPQAEVPAFCADELRAAGSSVEWMAAEGSGRNAWKFRIPVPSGTQMKADQPITVELSSDGDIVVHAQPPADEKVASGLPPREVEGGTSQKRPPPSQKGSPPQTGPPSQKGPPPQTGPPPGSEPRTPKGKADPSKKPSKAPTPGARPPRPDSAGSPFTGTCLPTSRRDCVWKVEVRERYDPTPKDTVKKGIFAVQYNDHTVTGLPDGQGFLMVATRLRALESDVVNAEEQGPSGRLRPDTSIADVVAWWSPDARFDDETLTGPLLLVDSLDARPDQKERLWLGVPAATVVPDDEGGSVFVYYAAGPSQRPYLDATTGYDELRSEPGVSVKRIDVDEILGAVEVAGGGARLGSRRRDPTDEKSWNKDRAVPGTLLGPVRMWAASDPKGHPLPYPVVPLASRYHNTADVVDPAPVSCKEGLQLFFGYLPRGGQQFGGPDQGQGSWHSAAIPDGMVMRDEQAGEMFMSRFGVDFIVAAPKADGDSADQLRPRGPQASEHGLRVFIDPDPVQLPDGRWIVNAGTLDGAGLWRFDGQASDGCTDWGTTWSR